MNIAQVVLTGPGNDKPISHTPTLAVAGAWRRRHEEKQLQRPATASTPRNRS